MGFVEDLKWWQWMLISLLVGAAMAYSATSANDVSGGRKDMDCSSFELNVLRGTFGNNKQPFVSNIVIHPPRLLQRGDDLVQMQLVTFDCIIMQQDHPGQADSEACQMLAPIPYEPKPRFGLGFFGDKYPGLTRYIGQSGDTLKSVTAKIYGKDTPEGEAAIISATPSLREAHSFAEMTIDAGERYDIPWNPAENRTVADFLIEAGKSGTPIKFRTAWWQSDKYAYLFWMTGSFLILGVVWPAAIQIMLKGGFGRPMEQEYDLSRFKSEPAKPQKPKEGVTAEDMQQLHALGEKMAESLKSSGTPATVKSVPVSPGGPAPIKKLAGGPADTPAAAQEKKEDKAYRGEFYPVERPSDKPKDAPPS